MDANDPIRETVRTLVSDVAELKTSQRLVSEFMLRNDQGREEMIRKLDRLIKSDDQWAGARNAFNITGKIVMGFVLIIGTWIAYLNVKPSH